MAKRNQHQLPTTHQDTEPQSVGILVSTMDVVRKAIGTAGANIGSAAQKAAMIGSLGLGVGSLARMAIRYTSNGNTSAPPIFELPTTRRPGIPGPDPYYPTTRRPGIPGPDPYPTSAPGSRPAPLFELPTTRRPGIPGHGPYPTSALGSQPLPVYGPQNAQTAPGGSITARLWAYLSPIMQQTANSQVRNMVIVMVVAGTAYYSAPYVRAATSYFWDLRRQKADIKASAKTMAAIQKAQEQRGMSENERQALRVLEAAATRAVLPTGISLTNDDLKEACRAKGLPVSGTNDVLSARIVESVESELGGKGTSASKASPALVPGGKVARKPRTAAARKPAAAAARKPAARKPRTRSKAVTPAGRKATRIPVHA